MELGSAAPAPAADAASDAKEIMRLILGEGLVPADLDGDEVDAVRIAAAVEGLLRGWQDADEPLHRALHEHRALLARFQSFVPGATSSEEVSLPVACAIRERVIKRRSAEAAATDTTAPLALSEREAAERLIGELETSVRTLQDARETIETEIAELREDLAAEEALQQERQAIIEGMRERTAALRDRIPAEIQRRNAAEAAKAEAIEALRIGLADDLHGFIHNHLFKGRPARSQKMIELIEDLVTVLVNRPQDPWLALGRDQAENVEFLEDLFLVQRSAEEPPRFALIDLRGPHAQPATAADPDTVAAAAAAPADPSPPPRAPDREPPEPDHEAVPGPSGAPAATPSSSPLNGNPSAGVGWHD
eukprot:tig00021517_g21993.t1